MREISIRELLRRGPKKKRAFYCNIWFRDHNNARMSALLPRMGFMDAFLVRMPQARIPRAIAFRVAYRTRGLWWRVVLSLAGQQYPTLFSNSPEQAL